MDEDQIEDVIEVAEDELPAIEEVEDTDEGGALEVDGEVESEGEDEGELVVTIEGEEIKEDEAEENASPVIRSLRKKLREAQKELKSVRDAKPAQAETPALPPKPTLEDFDYDAGRYEEALRGYVLAEVKHKEAIAAQEQAAKARQERIASRFQGYEAATKQFNADQFEDAESVFDEHFNAQQKAMLIDYLPNAAALVAYVGRKPDEAKRLAALTDHGDLLVEMTRLESKLTMSKAKKAPAPEKRLANKGSTPVGSSQKQLDKLREEAAMTGDYSKVTAYKSRMKASGQL